MIIKLGGIMEINEEAVIGKYEERFVRRLGEIAILLHLAKSPEGSHAYEMRSKASEILFERRKMGVEFLNNHLEIVSKLKEFLSKEKNEIPNYEQIKTDVLESLEKCPILNFNKRIQGFFNDDYQITEADINYIDEIKITLEDSIKETRDQATIWNNISGIYPAIETLEKGGLIVLDREDPEGGRLKKIYKITDVGEESLFRVLASLLDISAFIMETEGKHFFSGGRSLFSSRFIPFKKLFEKLTQDLSPDFRKKMHMFKGKTPGKPFIKMMMNQGMATPRLNVLIHHPEMFQEHLDGIESEEERKMTKAYLKSKLLEQRDMINKLLEEF